MSIPHIKNYCAGLITQEFSGKILAQERIRGLSNEDRKTLVKLFQGKWVDENHVNALSAEINRISKHDYIYKPKGFITDTWNAVKHLFGARIYSSEVYDEISSKIDNKDAVFAVNATYQTNGKGISDVAFANEKRGFGYIADGSDNNNPKMSKVLNSVLSKFNNDYAQEWNRKILNDVDLDDSEDKEIAKCISTIQIEISSLVRKIHNHPDPVKENNPTHMNDPSNEPTFSFAQIAAIDGKRKLFTVQSGSTMILTKKTDGTFDTSLVQVRPFQLNEDPTQVPVQAIDVDDNDVVYGFSSGISRFLTMDELQKCITNNRHPAFLLDEIKEFIINKGKNSANLDDLRNERSAIGNDFTIIYDMNDSQTTDDIGMFMLKV